MNSVFFFLKVVSSSYESLASLFWIYLPLPPCLLIVWSRRNFRKEEPWSEDGSLLQPCRGRAAPCPALQQDVLHPRQDSSGSMMCPDCPARSCCPLEINIQRKQRWGFGMLRERNRHALLKSMFNTSFAKQLAPLWEITSCQVDCKKIQTKQKKTPKPKPFSVWSSVISNINLQGGATGDSKSYALKDLQDAFLPRMPFY